MRVGASALLLFVWVTTLVGCATVTPPSRTLPSYVKRIYIAEFRNTSRLAGAQADLTPLVVDEFLADGRLEVVQNERADARLEGRIKSFRDYSSATSGDRFPLVNTMEMECLVELWDPYDRERVVPMARYHVTAAIQYFSDSRRSIEETQTEARERLMRQMAKNIVTTVIYGTPESPKALEQKAMEKYREQQGKQRFEPVISVPRFPKPVKQSQ
ncbi:MAG: LPS assembly lipoprotein LptE [Candidatus Sumerlaeaceae bacterium]|nr:LPS assembly lipoprotein LptE [Candidatus Sumerlaeaceae bacterium]